MFICEQPRPGSTARLAEVCDVITYPTSAGSRWYGSGGGGVSSSRHLAARTVGADGVPEMVTFWAKGALGPDTFVRDEGAW
jgi:hypothetical protein